MNASARQHVSEFLQQATGDNYLLMNGFRRCKSIGTDELCKLTLQNVKHGYFSDIIVVTIQNLKNGKG